MRRETKSYVNYALAAASIIAFFIVEATGSSEDVAHMLRCGAMYTPLISAGEWYRLLTGMFLHFGFAHLLGNMVSLILIGDYVERYLGHIRYLIVYICGGIISGWFSWKHEIMAGEETVSAGASGAVFAVIGALLVLVLAHKGRLEQLTLQRMLLMAAFSLYTGFRSQGVDGFAHLGGFLGGVAIAGIMVLTDRLKKELRE